MMFTRKIPNLNCFIVLVFSLFSQCDNKVEKLEYYENGSIKSKVETEDGRKNGLEYVYYPNGMIYQTRHFKNGHAHGMSTSFDKKGKLSKRISYYNGIREGPYEIYYSNGNIHEAGNFVSGYRRGKIYQYLELDSGTIKSELYVIDSTGYTYSIKRYDGEGNVIKLEKPFEVAFSEDTLFLGESATVKFRFTDRVYDSAVVIIGDFTDSNHVYRKADTVEFVNKEAVADFSPTKLGSQFFRGQWIRYRKLQDADSIYEYTSFGLFEEEIFVEENDN